MKNKSWGMILSGLICLLFLASANNVYAEKIKIKIMVENASIRLKPDATSEIIEKTSIGREFEAEEKRGEWYKIRFSSKLGVMITGYIHEKYVEVEKKPEPEERVIKPETVARIQEIPSLEKKFKVHLRFGPQFSLLKEMLYQEHGTPFRDETLVFDEYLEASSSFGFTGGAGIFISPNIEVTGNITLFSKGAYTDLSIDVPSPFQADDSAYDSSYTEPQIKQTIISLGINIHPMKNSTFSPYFGGGGSYVKGEIDLAESYDYNETQDPVLETHTVNITEVIYTKKSISLFGFNIRGGIDYKILHNVTVFAEGTYLLATKDVDCPLVEGETINIDLGGFIFCAGIKIYFLK